MEFLIMKYETSAIEAWNECKQCLKMQFAPHSKSDVHWENSVFRRGVVGGLRSSGMLKLC